MKTKVKNILNIGGDDYEIIMDSLKLQENICILASSIYVDYLDLKPLLLVVLNGGLPLGKSLSGYLKDLGFDYDFDTIQTSRYSGEGKTSEIRMLKEPTLDLRGRHVIVVEDLVDEGDTLEYMNNYVSSKKPASIEYCVLVEKPEHKKLDFLIKYKIICRAGLKWLAGFGMNVGNGDLARDYGCICEKLN